MADMSRDEQIGFHKGSLDTLAKERQELLRMAGVVDQLISMHLDRLRELGVSLGDEAPRKKENSPIEDLIR